MQGVGGSREGMESESARLEAIRLKDRVVGLLAELEAVKVCNPEHQSVYAQA